MNRRYSPIVGVTKGPVADPEAEMAGALRHFTWHAVFGRVEKVWNNLIS